MPETDLKRNFKEAIVYAWAGFSQERIGGRKLDSSYDRYDVEYGWTAEDYRSATGGTLVNFYTVGIAVFSLNTQKDNDIAIRLNRVPDERVSGASMILHGSGDIVVLHKSGKRLLDIGNYGIFDTLNEEKLYASPNEKDEILTYNGTEIYFIEKYPPEWGKGVQYFDSDRFNPYVFKIDLEEGLREGMFHSKEVHKAECFKEVLKKNHEEKLWRRYLTPFTFEVDGKTYTVDNKRMKNWAHIESTRIIDDNRRVVLEGHRFMRYIVDAIGFSEDILSEKLPKLRR